MDPDHLAQQRVSPRSLEDVLEEIRRFDRLRRELYPTHASLKFPTSGPSLRFDWLRQDPHATQVSSNLPDPEPETPQRSTRVGRVESASKRIKYEPMLEDIEEEPMEEASEPATPIDLASPDRSSSSPKSLGKKKSFSNLRLRFKRSAASFLATPRKASLNNDILLYLGNETVLIPQSEYNLRGKHWLLAARQVGSAATSQWHPHHPFIWTSQNLWCTACTRYSVQVHWCPPRFSGGSINSTKNNRGKQSGLPTDIVIQIAPHQGAYRNIPLVCVLCRAACCIHGGKKLEVMQKKTRISDVSVKTRPSPSRSFKLPAQSDAEAELTEIEASFAFGPDPESFVTCMQIGCSRLVCPACASRCSEPLCGLILCSECWPEQEGVCGLHLIVDVRVDIPPHPTRSPPPPPPPRSPPPPPPSRPPPPPPIPPRNPRRLRRRSAPILDVWSPGRPLRLSKSLPSLRHRSVWTVLST